MTTAIYIAWALLPFFFFVFALWSLLERAGGSAKHGNAPDLMRQGLFVLACVVASYAIDKLVIEDNASLPISEMLWRILLLPVVLVVGAKIVGPSKDIRIGALQTQSELRRKKK